MRLARAAPTLCRSPDLPRPRPVTLVGLALVTGALVTLVWVALTSAVVYYVTPSELAAHRTDQSVRLYGIVVPGSERWDATIRTLSFSLTDGATTVNVTSTDLPTDLFRDGVAVVVEGHADGVGHFAAGEVLVKHSEVYGPLSSGQTIPPGVLQQLQQGTSRP